MTMSKIMTAAMMHIRIFMSFHHICFLTRLAPRRNPCAETARLSVLSCSESKRSPRSETLLMLSRMIPTVLSISWSRHVSSYFTLVHQAIMRVQGLIGHMKANSMPYAGSKAMLACSSAALECMVMKFAIARRYEPTGQVSCRTKQYADLCLSRSDRSREGAADHG